MNPNPKTVRLKTNGDGWTEPMPVEIMENDGGLVTLRVLPLRQTWMIGDTGMIANIGGNCPYTYEIHPDDCKAICGQSQPTTP